MNRIQEIRATNPEIKFPKRKHNNDFIWDKQFPQDQRKKECNLQDYPSAEDVVEAWKEGIKMAKDLARRLGMHPDQDNEDGDGSGNDDDDDDNDGGCGGSSSSSSGNDDGDDDRDSDNEDGSRRWFDSLMTYS